MRLWRALVASFSYFSILPVPSNDARADGEAIALLPVVGVIIGGVAGLGAYGVFLLTHAALAAALVAWLLSIALSGAIHVDGFLDCCDGLFAMAPPERRLEIMRDPHHGTYAVAGMTMLAGVWLYALLQVPPTMLPLVLAMTGALARMFGSIAAGAARGAIGIMGAALGLVPYFTFAHGAELLRAFLVFLPAPLAAEGITIFARRRLGGRLSGDCYGAIVVVTEVVLLLAVPFAGVLR